MCARLLLPIRENEPQMNEYIEILREIVVSEASWVLFEGGTCVFLIDCDGDLATAATELLREVGPVEIGSSQADFAVMEFDGEVGWGVTFDHPDLLTLVLPREISAQPSELMIGLLGRTKRGDDAEQLKIAHIEDRRDQ